MGMLIAKPNTWFKPGNVVELIDDYRPQLDAGLFCGIRITEDSAAEGGYAVGEERMDEEVCTWDEFEQVD